MPSHNSDRTAQELKIAQTAAEDAQARCTSWVSGGAATAPPAVDETAALLSGLNEASSRLWRMQTLREGLDEILAATVELLQADFGHIQLLDPRREILQLVAERGGRPEFLASLRELPVTNPGYWTAAKDLESMVVEDTETDPMLEPMRSAGQQAGFRYVECTPLIGRGGNPLGILATYFLSPHRPNQQALRRLDLYVRHAADFIERSRIEERLRDGEERLRLALQAGRMGAWDWDIRTNAVTWSPMLEAIHGLEAGSFGGTFQAFQEDMHWEDRQRVIEALALSIEKDSEYRIEYRIVPRDGSVRWVEANGALVRDDAGAPVRMIGVCTDITERKQAEETIRSLLRICERLNSTLDMNALLDILVQEAIALVGAESGVAGLHAPAEGMRCQKYFRKGVPLALEYCWPSMHGLPGWLIVHKVPYLTNHAMADTQIVHELCVQFGVTSALSTPILSNDGQVLGFFEIHNKEGGFTEADKKTLLAVSHSASIAIQNAIAYRRIAQAEISTRERERTQRLLAEIGEMGGNATSPNGITSDALLQGILDRVATELQASRCGWSDVDMEAGKIIVRKDVHKGFPSLTGVHELSKYAEHMVEDGRSGRTTVLFDLSTDPRTAPHFEDYEHIGVRSYINVPLHREGRWVSSLWVCSHFARSWTKGEAELLHAVGNRVWQVIEQSRVSAALRDSEERFARFMEHLPGLAWIKDLEGRYVFVNTAAERAFRKSREQLYGRADEEVFAPETAAQFRENDRYAAASESGIQTLETLEQADGMHHSLVHKFPIRGRNGEVGWVGGMAIDITERVRAEEALRASEQRYRAVVESQAEMVCRFRPDGKILFVNGAYARATGRTREELEGNDFWGFVAAEDRTSVQAMLDSLTPDAPEVRIENRFETVDGERWTLWTNRALAFDDTGNVMEAQATGIDITDRKRAEVALQRANEALRRANADLEQFAYSASHDLREPIRNISLTGEILALRYAHLLDERALEHLSFVTSGAKRMDMLVRDLLAYTQSTEPDHEEIVPEATDAGVALEKAVSDLSTAILESNAVITADQLPKVRLWEVQLQQLFQNLISNAIKYRSDAEDPRIHIEAVRSGSEWIFAVRDNGMGIAPEHRDRVFGIFKRLHGVGKYPGTGIGLAICKRIVERHGGRIWVESYGRNRGSTFFFALPTGGAE